MPQIGEEEEMRLGICTGFLLAVSLIAGCTASPDAGYEAVKVRKPLVFGHGGVVPDPVKTGRDFVAPTTQVLYIDVRPIQFTMAIDDMFSKDNVPLDFNAAMRVRVTNSVRMVVEFGADNVQLGNLTFPSWYVNNIAKPWERAIRRAVKSYGMSEMVSDVV